MRANDKVEALANSLGYTFQEFSFGYSAVRIHREDTSVKSLSAKVDKLEEKIENLILEQIKRRNTG